MLPMVDSTETNSLKETDMKNVLPLMVLASLALSACDDETISEITGGNNDEPTTTTTTTPTQNPLETLPEGQEPLPPSQAPDDLPTEPEPELEPDLSAPGPIDTPAQGGSVNELLNGSSAITATSHWHCIDSEGAEDDPIFLAFYGDGTGSQANTGALNESITWSESGVDIMVYNDAGYFATLFDILSTLTSSSFTADYETVGGNSGTLSCELTSGDPDLSGSSIDGTDDGPVITSPGETETPSTNTIQNTVVNNEVLDFWGCEIGDDFVIMILLGGGEAAIASSLYPDAIGGIWTSNSQGVTVTLADSNQLSFSSPIFDAEGFFVSDSVIYNGAQYNDVACGLFDLE